MGAMDIARSVAGFSGNSPVSTALVAVAITGNCISIILTLALVYTFVKSVWMEGSVGDQRVYENLIMFFNSLMWALYTTHSVPYKPFFFSASAVGFVAQMICILIYIYFAKGKKRTQAIFLLFAVIVIVLIITILVASLIATHRCSTFINVIALLSGASMHIVTLFDLVMKRKEINNMNPITTLISLFGAFIWTAYGFMSVPVNPYIVVPNLLGILSVVCHLVVYLGILSAVCQLVVYLIYRMMGRKSIQIDDANHNIELEEVSTSSPV